MNVTLRAQSDGTWLAIWKETEFTWGVRWFDHWIEAYHFMMQRSYLSSLLS